MRYLWKIEGVTKMDQLRNEDIRDRLKQEVIIKKIETNN